MRPVVGRLILLAAAQVGGAAVSLALPAAMADAVDRVLAGRGGGWAVSGIALLLAAAAVCEVSAEIAAASCGARATATLRRSLLRRILAVGVSGRNRHPAGDLTSRVVGSATDAGQIAVTVVGLATSAVTSLAGTVLLWRVDVRLGVVLLLSLVPALLLVRMFATRMSDLFVRYQELQADIAARLLDALDGIRTIRAAGTLDQEIARVLEPLPDLSATGAETWARQRSVVWRMSLLVPLIEVAVLTAAGLAVVQGRLLAGQFLAAAGYTTLALGFLNQVDSLAELARATASARRVTEIPGAAAEGPATPGAAPAPGPGRVTLRQVTVRRGGRAVLDGVDVEIPAGYAVAVVGRPGAGKSTFAQLIGRLVEPDGGEVMLDDTPVTRLDPVALRRAVAYAFERPVLLGETVHEAVAYGHEPLSRAVVERAARLACADSFVRRLPEGYDTPLADLRLSGGEAQRLGLARALVGEAGVLVLDDATSSLDTVTEMRIGQVIAEDLAGRTRVIIARRLAAAAGADLVVWLDDGRIRAVGRHPVLWSDPEYRAVFGRGDAA
ncbi:MULTISPECIES: ABC transporter ATP-binding protein [Kitasatospora]|uniref:ABC transporter ATP-binding protein n=1 Tax=Kitasatospora TaxID=2063 RepID=UPI0031DC6868